MLLTPTLAEPSPLIGALKPSSAELTIMNVIGPLKAGWFLKVTGLAKMLSEKSLEFIPYTPLFNVTGQPAMSVPLHWNDAGLPVGMQFAARFGDEATVRPRRLANEMQQRLVLCCRPVRRRYGRHRLDALALARHYQAQAIIPQRATPVRMPGMWRLITSAPATKSSMLTAPTTDGNRSLVGGCREPMAHFHRYRRALFPGQRCELRSYPAGNRTDRKIFARNRYSRETHIS